MVLQKIRSIALLEIRKSLQNSLLVAFISEIFISILLVFLSLNIKLEMLEDFIYLQKLPEFSTGQIATFSILFAFMVFWTPVFQMGAVQYYLKLMRKEEVGFTEVFSYIRKPVQAWMAYGYLFVLYIIWTLAPMFLLFLLLRAFPGLLASPFASLLGSLVALPVFYARLRYFAYIYLVVDGQYKGEKIPLRKAAKESAGLLKGSTYAVLSMTLYFLFVTFVLELFMGFLSNFGIFGDVLLRFIILALSTWMGASFAGLYCLLKKEQSFINLINQNIEQILKVTEQYFRSMQGGDEEPRDVEEVQEHLTEEDRKDISPEPAEHIEEHKEDEN